MPDATSPADELEKLEHDLADNQKNAERLKAQIADLKKTAGEVEQKTKDLDKAADDLAKQKADLDAFVKREKKMLEATVDKAAIQKLKQDALAELKALADGVTAAAQQVQTAETAVATAKKNTAAKQAVFDKDAAIPATNAEILKDAAALQDKAKNEGKANNFSKMYFLVLLMEERLAQLNLISSADYTQKLNDDAAALTAATNAERAAKEALDAANAAQKDAQKKFDAKKAKWRQETLDKIPAGNGAQDRSAAVPPPPANATTESAPPPA